MNYDSLAIAVLLLVLIVIEALAGFYTNSKRSKDDWWIEIMGVVHSSTVSKPLIVVVTALAMATTVPHLNGVFSDISLWVSLPFVMLTDDFIQYWYHRKAHEWKWLWNLHRPHHSGPEMGVLVSFKENIFYVMIIPNIWFLAVVTYMGMGTATAIGLVAKYVIILGAHSNLKWDQGLYKHRFLHPLAWIIERTISTPATHYAHHGKSSKDEISNPTGNFSNMFFFWDVLHGTAVITRQYPTVFGIENDPKDHWASQLYWPIVKSRKPNSEIGDGYSRKKSGLKDPIKMDVFEGKVYWWCSCGYSSDQPFCNGSHNGTRHKPLKVEFEKDRTVLWCTCKQTASPPFCDGSHKKLNLD